VIADTAVGTPTALDLFSTSQKICIYSAPFLAIVRGNRGSIIQTCCNHWDCPRCGQIRAREEYGRIVEGARLLGKSHTLYFYTFTCRGRYLSLHKAERNYLLWTNRLLSTMRARCKAEGGNWVYVQVTERQKRGHPHSHLLMAWIPNDGILTVDNKGKDCIASKWFSDAHFRAGLGSQSKITPVNSVEATAKYIAKYLFKDAMMTRMPKGWKRVRYSQNFPSSLTKERDANATYITIKSEKDWKLVAKNEVRFATETRYIYELAFHRTNNVDYVPIPIP